MSDSSFLLLREIGCLKINEQEMVRFSIDAYHGYRFVSIRRYIQTEDFTGPTRDGVTLTPEIVQALVPLLQALPTDEKELKPGSVGKFAKRPGVCVMVTISDFRAARSLELRGWSQEKGLSKTGIFLPLTQWKEIRRLFAETLAALNEVPNVEF